LMMVFLRARHCCYALDDTMTFSHATKVDKMAYLSLTVLLQIRQK